jgi:hypothetical protein
MDLPLVILEIRVTGVNQHYFFGMWTYSFEESHLG